MIYGGRDGEYLISAPTLLRLSEHPLEKVPESEARQFPTRIYRIPAFLCVEKQQYQLCLWRSGRAYTSMPRAPSRSQYPPLVDIQAPRKSSTSSTYERHAYAEARAYRYLRFPTFERSHELRGVAHLAVVEILRGGWDQE